MANLRSDCLAIHVFAGTIGESIAIQLPNGDWGVVDCYASSIKDELSNPTLQFLRENGVKRLHFLCMTHPHRDHFRGMSQLLTHLEVDQFWRPSGMSGPYLGFLLKNVLTASAMAGNPILADDANELETIFTKVKSLNEKKKLVLKDLTSSKLLLRSQNSGQGDVEVWSIGPTAGRRQKYEEYLSMCIQNGKFRFNVNQHHNLISTAIRIKYGTTNVVLGGDVERDGWAESLQEHEKEFFASSLVKVSHHGSENGFSPGLWSAFAAGKSKPIAVVTPFVSQSLPKSSAIDHIAEFASEIVTPCPMALSPECRVRFSAKSPIGSRIALSEKLKARSTPMDITPGRCSFYFRSDGRHIGPQPE